MDLRLEECGDSSKGREPDWYDPMKEDGWESVISVGYKPAGLSLTGGDSNFGGKYSYWGLCEGLCPNQPFLVEFTEPRWYQSGYEHIEYNVEYYWDIVCRVKRSPKQAARAWDQWVKVCTADTRAMRIEHAEKDRIRKNDLSAMYIVYDTYWSSFHADDECPDGTIVQIGTSHGGSICSGRSHGRDYTKQKALAWEDLRKNVEKNLPRLNFDDVRKLPVKARL